MQRFVRPTWASAENVSLWWAPFPGFWKPDPVQPPSPTEYQTVNKVTGKPMKQGYIPNLHRVGHDD